MLGAQDVGLGVVACTDQIAQSLVLITGNPDRGEVARPRQPGKGDGIAPFSFDSVARPFPNQRRRDDLALNSDRPASRLRTVPQLRC